MVGNCISPESNKKVAHSSNSKLMTLVLAENDRDGEPKPVPLSFRADGDH